MNKNKRIFALALFALLGVLFTNVAYAVDVSIDSVVFNGKALAESKTNLIEKDNEFSAVIGLTAIKDLSNIHVETILTDTKTGNTISDSTGTFILNTNQSTLAVLNLELIDSLKSQKDFRLTVKVVDVDGDTEQKSFGIKLTSAATGARGQLDVSIDGVEVDGDAIAENENNFVVIGKGEKKLDLSVRLTSLENVNDAHVDAVLAFENGDVVADATTTFDIADGENMVKSLELPLISRFEQSSFKLKVRVVDAEGDAEEKQYGLKISQKKFPFAVSSISLGEGNIEAGKSLAARLSVKNSGVVPLDGITASVSIPEIGVSSTKFIGTLRNSKDGITDDFILKIPDSVQTGTYTLRSEIASQFGGESEARELPVFILGKSEQKSQVVNDRLVINIPIAEQDIYNDGSEAVYPVILTNEGPDANTYSISLDGGTWAGLRLSDSNVIVIKPKEPKTINIFASASGSQIGEHIFLVTIKSDGKVLKQIPLKANVIAAKGILAAKLKNFLEIILIGIAVLIAVIGIFFGIRKYMQGDNGNMREIPDQEQGEAYY